MKALVAGGTGLVGQFLLKELEKAPEISSITALTRSSRENTPKITWKILDFDEQQELEAVSKDADLIFCCLGTTIKKAGSKEAFHKVDHDYVLRLAKATAQSGAGHFCVVSAMGANSQSKIFYNRVKGEMETDLKAVGFEKLHIFQPSLLLGPRQEKRLGEQVGAFFGKLVTPLLIGKLKNYRPVHVKKLAAAMLRKAKGKEAGLRVFRFADF